MECRPWGCPFGQACGLKDGVRACVEQPGRCTLAPATRFVTFDGANGDTVANGIYVVTALSDHGQPTWFRLLADVGDEGERPSVVALHLFTPQAFVTVKRDKKVWVNGVATTLPVEIPGMLNVTETQGTVRIERTPQLVVELSPAGEVTVTVTLTLSKKLCGFCGDFNGAATDDLRGPDGKLVGDAVAMAKAWRAPDFTH
ncbi:FCGBP protein, partial [Podargus strigoides]|nr:FCGBP protein [Podargus strigoides]